MAESTKLVGEESKRNGHSYGSIKYTRLEGPAQSPRFLVTRKDVIIVSVVLVSALVIIAVTLSVGLPRIREKRLKYYDASFDSSPTKLHTYEDAVVLTDGGPCAPIGREMLEKNGTAVDSAIALMICDGVVNPHMTGLGGGFFMVIYQKEKGTARVIDARETAPLNAAEDMFHGNESLSHRGGLSIAVPGELRGYFMAHRKYGVLPWSDLIMPSVKLCREGFEVGKHFSDKLEKVKADIMADSLLREAFYNNETGDLYKPGQILKRPLLGDTLETIANEGADVLYTGALAGKLAEDIQKCGGIITVDDLKDYQPLDKKALKVELKTGHMLYTAPPPSSGILLAFILNVLDGYHISASDENTSDLNNTSDAVLLYHRIIETFKFAYARRSELEDESFANLTMLLSNLSSSSYAKMIQEKISDTKTFPPAHYDPVFYGVDDHGTSHSSVVAPNGDAVSVTSTINTLFGSMCMSKSTGILLNNEMDDFSSPNITNYFDVPPSPANFIASGKRPMSSMSPAILVDKDGNVFMVIGAAGGTRIISSAALGLIRVLWLNKNIKEAVDAPRFHHQLFPNEVMHEKQFPKLYLDQLKKFGHEVSVDPETSVVFGIVRTSSGSLQSALDFRRGGSIDGINPVTEL